MQGQKRNLHFSKSIFFDADKENTPCEPFTEPMAGGGLSGKILKSKLMLTTHLVAGAKLYEVTLWKTLGLGK